MASTHQPEKERGGTGAETSSSAAVSSSTSTPASAPPEPTPGANNSYIWRKADYFFPKGRHAGSHAPSPTEVQWKYLRAALFLSYLISIGLVAVNGLLLPLQLLTFGLVAFAAARGSPIPWPRWSVRVSELLVGSWHGMVGVVLEKVLGMRVQLAGDVLTPEQVGEGALLLCNHPSTADWVYLWAWLARCGDITRLKIVLKGSLHAAPILGWAMQCVRYLFLSRQWQEDKDRMETTVRRWEKDPVQVLMFPEGTDLRPASYAQSYAFARKQAQQPSAPLQYNGNLQHLLVPRVTGFVHLIRLLRSSSGVRAVYDLTLASVPLPVTIDNFARGIVPKQVHVHLRRYDIDQLPQGEQELAEWILERWNEKDRLLEHFYEGVQHKRAAFPQSEAELSAQQQSEQQQARALQFRQFSWLSFWLFFFLLHGYALWLRPLLFVSFHALLCGVWVWLTKQYGGWDQITLNIDRTGQKEEEKKTKKQR